MSLIGPLVALADSLTRSFGLQADVVYWAYTGSDGAGKPNYAPAVARKAIFTQKVKQVRKFDGEMGVSNAQVVFLDPSAVNPLDKIVTPVAGVLDVSTFARDSAQPIIATDAFHDNTNAAILTEIYLGSAGPF